jgi:deoxycytidylate deaminase
VYYEARDRAMSNGRQYHLAAILRRKGKLVRLGVNNNKTHPRFKRQYKDGSWSSHLHAEMDVLRFAQPGDEIEIMRFRKCSSDYAMAKPCQFCQAYLREAGIKRVLFTNDDGEWEEWDMT